MSSHLQIKKVLVIARYTFIDLIKSKILLNCLFIGLALLLGTIVASEFTYGTPQKVALDFGLGVTSISSVAIAIFMGVSLIAKELENRTIYSILSRNISRSDFIIGKFIGLAAILFLNMLILYSLTFSFYMYLGGQLNSVILFCSFFSFIEALTCMVLVVFFSLLTNSVLSVVFSIGVYICGYTIDMAIEFSEKIYPATSKFLNFFNMFFPSFNRLNIKDHVIYQEFLSTEFLAKNMTIGSVYLFAIIILTILIFSKKSLD